jgi:hypothetical protein
VDMGASPRGLNVHCGKISSFQSLILASRVR